MPPAQQFEPLNNRALALYVFVTSTSITAAILLNFLLFHGYNPFLPEALLCLLVPIGIGLIAMGTSSFCKPLSISIVALICALYLDYLLQPRNWKQALLSIFNNIPLVVVKISVAAGVLILIVVVLHNLGRRGWRVLSIGAVLLLASTAGTWWMQPDNPKIVRQINQSSAPLDLPIYLHIIFDGHMGIEWLPRQIPMAQVAERKILDFYSKYNFLLLTHAFSRHGSTKDSIPALMNFRKDQEVGLQSLVDPMGHDIEVNLKQNDLFDVLAERGYLIRVYQPTFIDYCREDDNVSFCIEYENNSIGVLQKTNLPIKEKFFLILGSWLSGSAAIGIVTNWSKDVPTLRESLRNVPILGVDAQYNTVGPLSGEETFQRLRDDVKKHQTGYAYFAHFLLPHEPYVYDSECRVKTNPGTWTPYHTPDPISWEKRYKKYFEQILCVYRALDNWFTELAHLETFRDALIIFQGDHGSRISFVGDGLTLERQQQDFFSTLFAVHAPFIQPGLSDSVKPVDLLLMQSLFEPNNINLNSAGSAQPPWY